MKHNRSKTGLETDNLGLEFQLKYQVVLCPGTIYLRLRALLSSPMRRVITVPDSKRFVERIKWLDSHVAWGICLESLTFLPIVSTSNLSTWILNPSSSVFRCFVPSSISYLFINILFSIWLNIFSWLIKCEIFLYPKISFFWLQGFQPPSSLFLILLPNLLKEQPSLAISISLPPTLSCSLCCQTLPPLLPPLSLFLN